MVEFTGNKLKQERKIMLKFEPFSYEKIKKMTPYLRKNTSLCSDLYIGAIFMWHSPDAKFCLWNDTLVIHQSVGGQKAFSYPFGPYANDMIDQLLEYALENNIPLRFYAVEEKVLELIKNDARLKNATWSFDERWSDYIYSFAETLTFSGKKYSGQRNHINKFKKLYGEPDIRLLTKEELPEIYGFLDRYEEEHIFKNKLERLEFEHTKRLVKAFEDLKLIGAYLKVDGEMAALSIGEIAGDMLLIHVEKALKKYEGIYPTMYQGFVKLVYEVNGETLNIINREDDSGDMGLRTSKLQYKPIGKVHKYMVHVNSPMAKIVKMPVIKKGSVVITGIEERDKKEYLLINTDVLNNQFWGYDYREDPFITGDITEDTFFDSVMHDMKTGDSINFAIRESEDGGMIGEGILWNFTYDGTAELGLRIRREYHKKGYGGTSFGIILDFAREKLDLKVWSRCFKENEASRRMIEKNGLKLFREDETYFYFE